MSRPTSSSTSCRTPSNRGSTHARATGTSVSIVCDRRHWTDLRGSRAGSEAAAEGLLGKVRDYWRYRNGRQASAGGGETAGRASRQVSVRFRADDGRQPVWGEQREGLREEIRHSLQAAPRRRRQVLRVDG